MGRPQSEQTKQRISEALRGRKLSPEHRANIGQTIREMGMKPPANEHLVGPRHWNWQGGKSKVRQTEFNKPEYRAFRLAVLERDDWTCQDCGKRGGRLHAHHMETWGARPDLRYAPENGVTLCPSCHTTRHRGVPRPPSAVGARTLADLHSDQT